MLKLKKIWRAFVRGFWMAWNEVPPKEFQRDIGELTVTVNCDTSQFDKQVKRVLDELEQIQKATPSVVMHGR